MTAIIVTSLLIVANVLGASMAAPQAVRLVRTRNVEGVSALWAGVSVSMNTWWLVYGLANGLWGLVPVSGVAAVLYLVIAFVFVTEVGRAALAPVVVSATLVGAAPLAFLAVGGWALTGLAIGFGYGLQLAPAVIAAFRATDLRGIAPATWVIAWIEAAIWIVYGWYVADLALLVGGTSGVTMATAILLRLLVTGHEPFRMRRPAWALG